MKNSTWVFVIGVIVLIGIYIISLFTFNLWLSWMSVGVVVIGLIVFHQLEIRENRDDDEKIYGKKG